MKKLLLLGGSAQQVIAIETAKRMGVYTILCDYLPDNPGQYAADKFYLLSTTDKAAVLDVATKERVDGVIAYASDPAAPTAAYVAQELGLPGNPYDAVEILCNKDRFRAFLRENGFHAPTANGFASYQDAMAHKDAFCYPVMVKPVDSSGSKGATVLRSADGLAEAVEFAFSFSRGHRIIVEEFIEKKHPYLIGGDLFVVDGKVILWGLLNCHRDPSVNDLVPVGKSYPLMLDDADAQRVKETLQALVTALGIRNGSMNVELVVDTQDRVWPIDIGPRSGGNMIPDLLSDMFGVDIATMSVQAAMGEPIDATVKTCDGVYATHNLHSDRDGIYRDVVFSKELEAVMYRRCLYKTVGDPVEYFDNAAKCLGIVFMKFDSKEAAASMLANINDHIRVELE